MITTFIDSLGGEPFFTILKFGQLPVGLIAQLVEHCTGVAEVMDSNPVQG